MARTGKVVVGLGETGLSYARYLTAKNQSFIVMDHAPTKLRVDALVKINANADVRAIDLPTLLAADEIFVSPGVPLNSPEMTAVRAAGKTIRGDVEMFGELINAPYVAITGTNGKSTVSVLFYQMALDQLKKVSLAGNIGIPCLDVIDEDTKLYVLELSSYQLELATHLIPDVAVVLNLSPDHLDRYKDADSYYQTKLALYRYCRKAVVNREMLQSHTGMFVERSDIETLSFGLDEPQGVNEFGIKRSADDSMLMNGDIPLVAASQLRLSGDHNLLNVLAALAIGKLLGLDMSRMIKVARRFEGLAHRGQNLGAIDGVAFINDSKATNIGAMLAAVEGLPLPADHRPNVILILGGVTKGVSFSGVARRLAIRVKQALVIGLDPAKLAEEIEEFIPTQICESMSRAVQVAGLTSSAGDVVLLAPGCASFDQYDNYKARGDDFVKLVRALSAEPMLQPNERDI